ncbi:MAG: AMP-binding protein [Chitinophagales bacterium]|nr:AMP-binding protein [Chitinophagales bacterium]
MPVNVAQQPLAVLYQNEQTLATQTYLHQPIKGGTWQRYTWSEAANQARRMATALRAMNLPPNSHIALMSKNCAHWMMADLAIMMSGHISVPLYPNINAETMRYILEHSESKLLFVGKLDDWDALKSGLPDGLRCISFPTFYGNTGGFENWDTLCAQYEALAENPLRDLKEIATIIYTSGTTGKPKGVVMSFKALSYATNMAFMVIDLKGKTNRFFSYLPLSHIAERMLVEMGALYSGGEVYFAESLDTFADNLRAAQPTVFLGVPRIWTKFQMGILSKMPQRKLDLLLRIPLLSSFIKLSIQRKLGLHRADYCLSGAAPIPPSLIEWFAKLGITIQEAYGMTENCAYSHYTRQKPRLGSVGQAMPEVEVVISDIGEILVKSEALMDGYYKQPELTADVLQNGYLHTGDKGTVSKDGFLFITGRVKEIFKTEKGKYVAPAPIEMQLCENTHIEQVCVTGANLPQPIALAVLSADAAHADHKDLEPDLEKHLKTINSRLDAHERLKCMVIVREPWTVENNKLTPTLKIKREPIEQLYMDRYHDWYESKQPIIWE